jgi:hypothetical protein
MYATSKDEEARLKSIPQKLNIKERIQGILILIGITFILIYFNINQIYPLGFKIWEILVACSVILTIMGK